MNMTGCLKCGDEKAVLQKSGFKKTKAGSFQRFLCTSCGKHFTGQERHRRHTAAEQQRALMEHEEGLSMRAAARLAGVHLRSVQRWIEKKRLFAKSG